MDASSQAPIPASVRELPPADRPFRVLCLSGGGYLGLFSARILARMEAVSRRPIVEDFDFICGTSVGAVTAMALSTGVPAAEVEAALIRNGPLVFARRSSPWFTGWAMSFVNNLFRPRYGSGPLRQSFEELLGAETRLADARCKLAIPTVNMTTGQIEIFKTPHNRDWSNHGAVRMAELGLAAAAAPTFFPLMALNDSLYVDGGLFANAPDLVGLHEAEYYLKVPTARIRMLSVGTTTSSFSLPHRFGRDYGIVRWLRGARLWSTILAAQQQMTHGFLLHHLGPNYLRIDSVRAPGQELDLGFDRPTEAATHTTLSLADFAFEHAMKHEGLGDFFAVAPPRDDVTGAAAPRP
jgi:hypothetical protein